MRFSTDDRVTERFGPPISIGAGSMMVWLAVPVSLHDALTGGIGTAIALVGAAWIAGR